MPPTFDPSRYPSLADLGARLRELAGDASYKAGRDYLRKGLVRSPTVAGTTAFATVTGSADYRVSVGFATALKPSCTCPAFRRSPFCKHVVALCAALLERPREFAIAEPLPEQPKPLRAKKDRKADERTEGVGRGAGLETVDRLLAALAAEGLVGLGPDKLTLFANAGELVRARKLRRLGNQILTLQRAAESPGTAELDPGSFARLLVELHLTRQATGAQLEGRIALAPQAAEDLLGKTWRESELEPVTGLDLVEVAATAVYDGEFRIETGYLVDLPTGTIYAEKAITPMKLRTPPRPRYRTRLLVDEAGLYPGAAPRRIRLGRARQVPLTVDDTRRLVRSAVSSAEDVRARLVGDLENPFGSTERPVLFRPSALVVDGVHVGALDRHGDFIALSWPATWSVDLPSLLPSDEPYAVVAQLDLTGSGLLLRCLSVVGALGWERGPFYPDGEERRR